MESKPFIDQLDEKIQEKHLLNHPFYESWNAGELSHDTIQEYAAQYFRHVSLFPRYLSAIHSNCDEIKVRQLLLENLVEEEGGKENHPELWMRFGHQVASKSIFKCPNQHREKPGGLRETMAHRGRTWWAHKGDQLGWPAPGEARALAQASLYKPRFPPQAHPDTSWQSQMWPCPSQILAWLNQHLQEMLQKEPL